jgi:hypothetical protein
MTDLAPVIVGFAAALVLGFSLFLIERNKPQLVLKAEDEDELPFEESAPAAQASTERLVDKIFERVH